MFAKRPSQENYLTGLVYNTFHSTNPTAESSSSVQSVAVKVPLFYIFYRKFAAMKVRLLFFFSFVLASAALVQHGDKRPLSNNVEGSENSCCCIMRFVEKSFSVFVIFIIIIFMATFLLLKVYKFNHTMLVLNACISSHFRGLKFKTFPGDHAPGPLLIDSR